MLNWVRFPLKSRQKFFEISNDFFKIRLLKNQIQKHVIEEFPKLIKNTFDEKLWLLEIKLLIMLSFHLNNRNCKHDWSLKLIHKTVHYRQSPPTLMQMTLHFWLHPVSWSEIETVWKSIQNKFFYDFYWWKRYEHSQSILKFLFTIF